MVRNIMAKLIGIAILCVGLFALTTDGRSQPPGKKGFGKGKNDPSMRADMEVFQFLLDNRRDIKRTVKNIDDGVETTTESDVPKVTAKIQEHVEAMHGRVKSGNGIHLRDPLFAEIFKNSKKIELKIEMTDKGVHVKETSQDPYVVKLIQAHAQVVNKFIENGHAEMRKNHEVPAAAKK